MKVSEAVATRRSVRRFLNRPIERAVIEDILEKAQRAPSGGNVQPWHAVVATGTSLARLVTAVKVEIAKGPDAQQPEYQIYPPKLPEPYRSRRFGVGEAMYEAIGVERDNKMGRMVQFASNFEAFGAPVCLFVHTPRFMGLPQWSDLGMWMQTVMLLAREAGLDTCAQEAWSVYGATVRSELRIPDDHVFFSGLAIGYRDSEDPINRWPVPRAPLDEVVRFEGFEQAG